MTVTDKYIGTSFTHNMNVNFRKHQFFFIPLGWDLHQQGGVQFQWFFDSSLHHQDMATLCFMLTAADTYLYPVPVSKGGPISTDFLFEPLLPSYGHFKFYVDCR